MASPNYLSVFLSTLYKNKRTENYSYVFLIDWLSDQTRRLIFPLSF